ncbi:ATP-grasp domain-containing protein [Pseudonocardia saturnea]
MVSGGQLGRARSVCRSPTTATARPRADHVPATPPATPSNDAATPRPITYRSVDRASVVADTVTARDEEICARIADDLAANGLHFVGIDVIGRYLTEINVTSPTGVREIDAFAGTRMSDCVIEWVEKRSGSAG